MSPKPPRLTPSTDVSAAGWIVEEVGRYDSGLRGLLPAGFESYARILHPAWKESGHASDGQDPPARCAGPTLPRRWAGGCTASFSSTRWVGVERGKPRPYEVLEGDLEPALLSALCELLAGQTAAPERCWFCLWEGWGWVDGVACTVIITSGPSTGRSVRVPPAVPPEILAGPGVSIPGWDRDYVLFEGPLDAATEMGWRKGGLMCAAYPELDFDPAAFEPQSPSLFWPEDRSWCVATEIDLDSTYVGGSQNLVDALLSDDRFESWPADLDDRSDVGADEING